MQEFSKKSLLRSKILAFIGYFGVLKGEIKKLDIYKHWCEVSRTSTMLCVTHDNGEKFSQIFINTGK
ncbi:hypothetical protein G6W40_02655 [Campylobacter concisus]|uniref:hypothetical protein n=1 Tax=Campylobacter concisus TaxID=199 RepID=UPI00188373C6|nr:hypothetical protein [Campylobacter concisus]MBE9869310.1 hypothetical protein [Campylobacter concisus]